MTCDQLLQLATDKHRAGDLPGARPLYEQALQRSPGHAVTLFRLGLLELQAGHAEAAAELIRQAIASAPEESKYQFGLGEALAASGCWEEAAAAYRLALQGDPSSVAIHFSLGISLQSLGDYASAITEYELAAQYQPDFADALNNLGNCHQLTGNFTQATEAYRRALQIRPDFASALSNLGAIELKVGQIDAAIQHLRAAIRLEPDNLAPAINLGAALCQLRQFLQAAQLLEPIVQAHPNHAEAAYNLGNALHGQGQLHEAAEFFRRGAALRPNYADAFNNLGNVLKELGELTAAMAAYQAAITAQPRFPQAMNNASCVLRTMGRLDEAEEMLRRGLACVESDIGASSRVGVLARHLPTHQTGDGGRVRPPYELRAHPIASALLDNLGSVLKDAGRLDEAIDCFRQAVELNPDDAGAHGNLAYALTFQSPHARPISDECLRWNTRHAAPLSYSLSRYSGGGLGRGLGLKGGDGPLPNPPPEYREREPENTGRRLRVGYVAPDFRDHCQSLFTIPLLSNHDHSGFEIFCYSSVARPDDVTRRIAGYADVWRDVRLLDDPALCETIHADRIDILVDLTMHMANGRPLVFARKPAPIQIAWLAYPGTTGMGAIDYRLTDPRLDPPGFESHYAEHTIRLPDSFWCYDPLADQPDVNDLPAMTRGHVTFGCLNNPCKLTDATLRLWGAVLRELAGARLLLMAAAGSSRQHLLSRLATHGIAAGRVDFVPFRPRAHYLQTYHGIDLGLDTFPYNGHTTSLDSFWMGVPVVTRVGQTCVGRGGLSQLFHLDLLDLAAETDEAFVQAAVSLARDLPRLARLRKELRPRLQMSPLMDGQRFARAIETVYRDVFARYCAGPSKELHS